jgi:hypothetical protein
LAEIPLGKSSISGLMLTSAVLSAAVAFQFLLDGRKTLTTNFPWN